MLPSAICETQWFRVGQMEMCFWDGSPGLSSPRWAAVLKSRCSIMAFYFSFFLVLWCDVMRLIGLYFRCEAIASSRFSPDLIFKNLVTLVDSSISTAPSPFCPPRPLFERIFSLVIQPAFISVFSTWKKKKKPKSYLLSPPNCSTTTWNG